MKRLIAIALALTLSPQLVIAQTWIDYASDRLPSSDTKPSTSPRPLDGFPLVAAKLPDYARLAGASYKNDPTVDGGWNNITKQRFAA